MRTVEALPRRRALRALAAWVLTFGLVRTLIAQPEQCGTVTPAGIDHAIAEAVGWAARTQQPDGRWIYRYDIHTDSDVAVYEFVRHAGLMMSLYQAASAGVTEARQVAERADAYAREHLVSGPGWQALAPLDPQEQYDLGATSLYLNALLFRRELTHETGDDALLDELGHFLVANIAPSGALAAYWDPRANAPAATSSSPFSTGEALWAIARLENVHPGEWREPALRVAHYIATVRDEAEHRWPDVPDHWASHALAEMNTWPGPTVLDETLVRYAHHVADLESLEIRYESQRTGSLFSRLTRGQIALGAGVGALAEAILALESLPSLATDRDLHARASCAIGLLLHRQTTAEQAAHMRNPERTRGAWIREGVTQIDDQQHTMTALVMMREQGLTR